MQKSPAPAKLEDRLYNVLEKFEIGRPRRALDVACASGASNFAGIVDRVEVLIELGYLRLVRFNGLWGYYERTDKEVA